MISYLEWLGVVTLTILAVWLINIVVASMIEAIRGNKR